MRMSSVYSSSRQASRRLAVAVLVGYSAFGLPIENISPAPQSGSPASLANAIIRTVAGGRAPTGNARSSIYGTSSVAAHGGAVYISDFNTSSIYRLGPGGDVTRVAGSGVAGFAGDGSSATKALLGSSLRLALDESGDLFFADAANNRVRRVDAANGVITTVAGNGLAGFGGDQGPATEAMLNVPAGVAWHSGNLFIADQNNCVIRKVDVNGIITTVAGMPDSCAFGGDGGPAASALLNRPIAVTSDRYGNLLITDSGNSRVRRVDAASGVITTIAGNGIPGFAGDGGPATAAQLKAPDDFAVDEEGNLYIADTGNVRI